MNASTRYGMAGLALMIAALLLTPAAATADGYWTDYFDGVGFLLEQQRTRVYADFEWDGLNHLAVTCDDFGRFATAQEISPLGDVLTFYLWDDVTQMLYFSSNGADWGEVRFIAPGYDLQDAICSP